MLVLLDSTVLIDYLRGRPAVDRIRHMVAARDTLTTSALNVEEIVRGMRPSEASIVDRLLSGLIVVPVDEAVARLSGQWRSEYAARGVTLHQRVAHRAGLLVDLAQVPGRPERHPQRPAQEDPQHGADADREGPAGVVLPEPADLPQQPPEAARPAPTPDLGRHARETSSGQLVAMGQ